MERIRNLQQASRKTSKFRMREHEACGLTINIAKTVYYVVASKNVWSKIVDIRRETFLGSNKKK